MTSMVVSCESWKESSKEVEGSSISTLRGEGDERGGGCLSPLSLLPESCVRGWRTCPFGEPLRPAMGQAVAALQSAKSFCGTGA